MNIAHIFKCGRKDSPKYTFVPNGTNDFLEITIQFQILVNQVSKIATQKDHERLICCFTLTPNPLSQELGEGTKGVRAEFLEKEYPESRADKDSSPAEGENNDKLFFTEENNLNSICRWATFS